MEAAGNWTPLAPLLLVPGTGTAATVLLLVPGSETTAAVVVEGRPAASDAPGGQADGGGGGGSCGLYVLQREQRRYKYYKTLTKNRSKYHPHM
jgi:hypothetical protein